MERFVPVRLRFAEFEADFTTGELSRNGFTVALQSKPFSFLAALIKNPGEVITREDLSRALWPDTHVQTNQGLNAAIRKVRVALADDALSPRFIETLGSRGYRFICPVEVVRWSNGNGNGTASAAKKVRIAVLPVENQENISEVLVRGLTLRLIARLEKMVPAATVVSLSAGSSWIPAGNTFTQERDRLDVQYFLTRRICDVEGRLQMTVKLLQASDQQCLWSDTYEGEAHAFAWTEDAIASNVAGALRVRSPEQPTKLIPHTPFHAYEQYLLGRHFLNQRTPAAIRKGLIHFEQAVQADPTFARAYAGLADGYNVLGTHGMMLPREAFAKAKWAADMALMILPDLSEALVALSWARTVLEYDVVAGRRTAERALSLNPGYAFAYNIASYLAVADGSLDEAVDLMRRGRDLDPVSQTANAQLSYILALCKHYDEALHQAYYALDLDPRYPFAHACAGLAYLGLKRPDDAVEALRKALECAPGSHLLMAAFAHALAIDGQTEDARKLVMELINHETSQPKPTYHIGVALAALGETERAMDWLERAREERSNWLLFMESDIRLDPVRKHPKMFTLLAELPPAKIGT